MGTTTTLITTTAAVEASIAEYKGTLRRFQATAERIQESVVEMDVLVTVAVNTLEKEIDILGQWENNANTVSYNFSNYSDQKLAEMEAIRKVVRRGVETLQSSAKRFLEQPLYITGEH